MSRTQKQKESLYWINNKKDIYTHYERKGLIKIINCYLHLLLKNRETETISVNDIDNLRKFLKKVVQQSIDKHHEGFINKKSNGYTGKSG